MTSSIARQPQGVPVGGQFAATSHSEPGLTLRPAGAVSSIKSVHEAQEWLAEGGLDTNLKETKTGFRYLSPGGRRVSLRNLGTTSSEIGGNGRTIIGSGIHGASPQTDVKCIQRSLWDRAVDDASRGGLDSFEAGNYRPKADPSIRVNGDGDLTASLDISGDYDSYHSSLQHNYRTGETSLQRTVMPSRQDNSPTTAESVILSMKPGTDAQMNSRIAFGEMLARATADPDIHPDIAEYLQANPYAADITARFPQYKTSVDTSALEDDAKFFGHELHLNTSNGDLELSAATVTYSAVIAFQPDGSVVRKYDGKPVESFPAALRKPKTLEQFASNRHEDLVRAAAGTYVYQPVE